jgi:hypothetical protein
MLRSVFVLYANRLIDDRYEPLDTLNALWVKA